ncbi:MAG: SH3 domain-containing protein [Spirochaetales bacterium]|uniref:SH3 domain-containing protein n=1 Tax=Candidatus Thalassospirochaeta sargassi TaxID=3119039 RepID=A0AAJ1II67_9SPIO|nr:SH3 domain-containing protein [Spirochaetales bacterium]
MRKISAFIYIIILTSASVIFTACEQKEETIGDIELPPALLFSEAQEWAVIESSYLRLRERAEAGSRLVTTLWRGYVLEIISRSPNKVFMDDEEDYWYQVNYDGLQGWVFGSYLSIHESREAAETAARVIRND